MHWHPVCSLAALVGCIVLLLGAEYMAEGQSSGSRIVVVSSSKAAPYEEAFTGLQQALRQQGVRAQVDMHILEGDTARVRAALRALSPDDVLVTLGTSAMQQAHAGAPTLPLVAGMILSADELQGLPNATGVFLEFPWEVQVQWLRRLLPTTKTLGILYNPKENSRRIEAAKRAARDLGFVVEVEEVHDAKELPVALENLGKRIEVLWGVVDDLVLNPQTAKQILLFSFQNRIPLVGLSTAWVKAGALYALEWDYTDIGHQCGEMVVQILGGTSARAIPPAAPRKVLYTLNQKTARHMKIDLPESLVRGAREVF